MTARRLALLALVAVPLVAGCGGGGGPKRADYIARAERLCLLARAQTAPLVARVAAAVPSLDAAKARRVAADVNRLHALEARWLARLRALPQPSGDKAAIARFLTPAGELVDALGTAGGALGRGDATVALLVLQRSQAASVQARSAAQDYGFTHCAALVAVG